MGELTDLLIPMLAISGSFLLPAWIVWLVGRNDLARTRTRAEVQTRFLDRFSSAPELVSLLQTEEGQKLLDSFTGEKKVPKDPAERLLTSIRRGVVLGFLGAGLLLIGWATPWGNRGLSMGGIITLAVGLGFLASAGISLRLSRAWGLIPRGGTGASRGS